MQKITAADTLKKSISALEQRQREEGKLLRNQLSATLESIKPVNILRKIIVDIAEPSELKDNLIQTATGLISGYVSRKMLVRSSKNPLLRLVGVFVQYGVTNFVSKNSDSIKPLAMYYLNKLTNISRND